MTDDELQDSRVLGGRYFVEQILQHTEEVVPGRIIPIDQIIETVLCALKVSQLELMSRTRVLRVAEARSIICHVAYASGHREVDIARRISISRPGVALAVRPGKELIENHPQLSCPWRWIGC